MGDYASRKQGPDAAPTVAGAPGMEAFWAGVAKGATKPLVDPRVPGKAADASAMLPYIDADHVDDPVAMAAKVTAHLTSSTKQAKAFTHAKAQPIVDALVAAVEHTDERFGRYKLLNTLDGLDDPDLRTAVLAQFEAQTGRKLADVISSSDWHGSRDKAQAQALISPERASVEREMAALPAEERAKLQADARKTATQIADVIGRDSIDAAALHRALAGKSPAEIEAIRAAVREQSRGTESLYEQIDRSTSHGDEDEAVASLSGDPVYAASIALQNATGDATRIAEILRALKPDQIASLQRRFPAATFAWMSVAPDQRTEIAALVQGKEDDANGAKVADLFRERLDGADTDGTKLDAQSQHNFETRSTDNVLHELEKMSPEKLQAARTKWNSSAERRGEKTWDAMIEDRFGAGDPLVYMRIRALASGNKVESTALALSQGMRDHDQATIDAALANPDLSSSNPDIRARARDYARAVAARVQELDAGQQKAMAAMNGGDVASTRGRNLDTQLADHYAHQASTQRFESAGDVMDAQLAPDEQAARRKKRAHAAEIGTDELRETGSFSTATELHRARDSGDEKRVATILEGQADRDAVYEVANEYRAKYGDTLFETPDSEKVEAYRNYQHIYGNDVSRDDAAYAMRDSIENRIESVRTAGPSAVRSNQTQYELDEKEYRHGHSDAHADSELMRQWSLGRAAGSDERNRWALQNEAAAIDGPRAEFEQHAAHTRAMADMRRDEKIAMSERATQWLAIAGKIAALATMNPAAMAAIDALVGLATVLVREEIEGESYKTGTADLIDTGITVVNDLAMIPIGKFQSALSRAALTLGLSSATIVVRNDLANRSAETSIDLIKNTILSIVMNPAGDFAEKWLGGGKLGKGANIFLQTSGGLVANGPTDGLGVASELVGNSNGVAAGKHPQQHDAHAPRHADAASTPVRTPHGDVWPGDVPVPSGHPHHEVYKQANAMFFGIVNDSYQGSDAARTRWARHLVDNGIPVEGTLHDGGRHEVNAHAASEQVVAEHDGSVQRSRSVGERSQNAGHVAMSTCRDALDNLIARGSMLANARRHGDRIEVPRADGTVWIIHLAEPKPTHADQMAALAHGEHGDTVWVSTMLTNEEVPAALGAIIGESLARAGVVEGTSNRTGELDAMFAHREAVAEKADPTLRDGASSAEVKTHALEMSKKEATARIDAEIDLALARLGLYDPATREQQLASLPPALADQVRAQLAARPSLDVNTAAMRDDADIAKPSGSPASHIGVSEVLPSAPTEVRAYRESDRMDVMELRVELEIVREIDARTAQRDRPGTNGGFEIARGETRRREQHVKRAKELMEKLQLGGDSEYIKQRLGELASVFPGAANDVVPAIQQRVDRRDAAAASHAEAEAFRAERAERSAALKSQVMGMPVITTKRLVVGDGFSGLADVASLDPTKNGKWIDPHEMLVIGNPDLLDRLATYDPSFRWGQRAATYDRANDAHPAFSDAEGHGKNVLDKIVEDPGEFMHVGEVRDAMDLARQRLGMAAVPGEVQHVETAAERHPDSPAWEVDETKYPVRAKVVIDGVERFVYAESTDLATGPGKPRMPNETVLPPATRAKLMGETNGTGALFSGEKLLEGRDVGGKRVLVLAFGPTGAWTAKVAANQGATRVDFASASAGSPGTRSSPAAAHGVMASVDRVQDAIDGTSNIHVTMDPIIEIRAEGDGAVVTYASGPGENAEVYQVHYDVIVTTMGYSTAYDSKRDASPLPGEPTVKDMIGDMQMQPQTDTGAPVLEDTTTGRVRVTGFAAGDVVNMPTDRRPGRTTREQQEMDRRRADVKANTSADSPDERVVEGVGMSTRLANTGLEQQ